MGSGVKCFEDLIVWQLAQELEAKIFEFTSKPPASRDGKFCDQIREAIRSAGRNTSEGFGRYYAREFSRFLGYTAGSLHETKNQLHEALKRKYIETAHHERLVRLAIRATKANSRLIAYLDSCKTPSPFGKPPRAQPREKSTSARRKASVSADSGAVPDPSADAADAEPSPEAADATDVDRLN